MESAATTFEILPAILTNDSVCLSQDPIRDIQPYGFSRLEVNGHKESAGFHR
jgi:hypothetical protein